MQYYGARIAGCGFAITWAILIAFVMSFWIPDLVVIQQWECIPAIGFWALIFLMLVMMWAD